MIVARLIVLGTAACLPLVACDGESRIELGAGLDRYEALPEQGGTIEVVTGPQGGFHVDVGARGFHVDPSGLRLTYAAYDASDELISYETFVDLADPLVSGGPRRWTRLGDRVVMDVRDREELDTLVGLPLRLVVTLEGDGVDLTDERLPTLVDEVL